MVRFRFEWNTWSTGPITGCIVLGSWGLGSAIVALAFRVVGSAEAAEFLGSISQGLFLSSGALLVFAIAAGIAPERSSVGRARPPKVERTQSVPARSPVGISH